VTGIFGSWRLRRCSGHPWKRGHDTKRRDWGGDAVDAQRPKRAAERPVMGRFLLPLIGLNHAVLEGAVDDFSAGFGRK
jgi:hypothetical protein